MSDTELCYAATRRCGEPVTTNQQVTRPCEINSKTGTDVEIDCETTLQNRLQNATWKPIAVACRRSEFEINDVSAQPGAARMRIMLLPLACFRAHCGNLQRKRAEKDQNAFNLMWVGGGVVEEQERALTREWGRRSGRGAWGCSTSTSQTPMVR
eukprot:382990-Rhodomonas_salina.3